MLSFLVLSVLFLQPADAQAAGSADRFAVSTQSFNDLGPIQDYQPLSDGGYIACGYTGDSAFVVKYRADGTEQWRKVLSDPSMGTSQFPLTRI